MLVFPRFCLFNATARKIPCVVFISFLGVVIKFTMTGVFESPKARINASMLSQYISRPVCFLGRLEKVHPSGKALSLTDGEGKTASVELNEPLDEELSGIVEIIGMVSNKGTIMATSYTQYREDKIPFDLELYNEAVKVLHDYPQYYPFEVSASG